MMDVFDNNVVNVNSMYIYIYITCFSNTYRRIINNYNKLLLYLYNYEQRKMCNPN